MLVTASLTTKHVTLNLTEDTLQELKDLCEHTKEEKRLRHCYYSDFLTDVIHELASRIRRNGHIKKK